MEIHLAGHLNWYDADQRSSFEITIAERCSLLDLLGKLGVPAGEVAIALLNDKQVDVKSAWLENGDRLALYPPAAGG